jgi:hypothetical protein
MKITSKRLKGIIEEELASVQELQSDPAEDESALSPPPRRRGYRGSLSQGDTNAAKGAAMELLDTAKTMEQAPSHDPASNYAQFVAKQANLIMDILVSMGT